MSLRPSRAPDRNVASAHAGARRQLAARLPVGAEVIDLEPGHFVVGAIRNVMIVVWKHRATPEAVQRVGEAAAQHGARWPQGRSSVHVLIAGAEPPLEQAQEAFVRLMQRSQLSCLGVVFLGSGFWASTLRSQSTAMAQRSGVVIPFRQFGSISELALWLPKEHGRCTGVWLDGSELSVSVEAFVRELDAPQ